MTQFIFTIRITPFTSNKLGGVIRVGECKFIKRYGDGKLELFNLNDDIGEKKNLAQASPELAARLEKKLEAWLKKTDAKMPTRASTQ